MKTIAITIQLSDETHTSLLAVVDSCNHANTMRNDFTSHGALDLLKLLTLVVDDLAMTYTRPGSWEGSNMQRVLDGHGYEQGASFQFTAATEETL